LESREEPIETYEKLILLCEQLGNQEGYVTFSDGAYNTEKAIQVVSGDLCIIAHAPQYHIYVHDTFVQFHHRKYDNSRRPANGFKIHISIYENRKLERGEVDDNVADAWLAISRVLAKYNVPLWKIISPMEAPMLFSQRGKQITVYCSEFKHENDEYFNDEELEERWQEIIPKIEKALTEAGIRPCVPAKNETLIAGSSFITYAQDTDEKGKEISSENRSQVVCSFLKDSNAEGNELIRQSDIRLGFECIQNLNSISKDSLQDLEKLINKLSEITEVLKEVKEMSSQESAPKSGDQSEEGEFSQELFNKFDLMLKELKEKAELKGEDVSIVKEELKELESYIGSDATSEVSEIVVKVERLLSNFNRLWKKVEDDMPGVKVSGSSEGSSLNEDSLSDELDNASSSKGPNGIK